MISVEEYNEDLSKRIEKDELKLNDDKISFNFLTNKRFLNFMFADFETTNQKEYKELIKLYNDAENPKLRKKIWEEIEKHNFSSEVYCWGLSVRMPTQKKNNKYYINSTKIPFYLKKVDPSLIYFEDDVIDNVVVRTYIGHTIETFLDFVLGMPWDYKPICYFHNGGRFDFKYITEALDKRGFYKVQDFDLTLENEPWLVEERGKLLAKALLNKNKREGFLPSLDWIERKWRYLLPLEYRTTEKTALDNYTISTRYIDFWDSAKIYKMSIKGMGESLNNDFLKKTEIDYNAIEKKFDSLEELLNSSDNLIEYQKKDCLIGFSFMANQIAALEKMKVKVKSTAASTAYNKWLNLFANNYINQAVKDGEIERRFISHIQGYKYRFNDGDKWVPYKLMKEYILYAFFPTDLISEDIIYLRNWYRGGVNQFNPTYQGTLVKSILVSDINSSYPSVMYSDEFYPYGQPLDNSLYDKDKHIYLIKFKMKRTKKMIEGYVPFVPEFKEKNSYGSAKYISEVKKGQFFYMCQPEFEYFKKAFDISNSDIKEEDFIIFKKIKGEKLFGDFMSMFYDIKTKASIAKNNTLKEASKIFLNGLYGKFGSKWDGNQSYKFENGEILEGQKVDLAKYYLPLGIFITAYARLKLVKAGEGYWKSIIYMDTDSIYYLRECDIKLKLDSYKLGWWDEKEIDYMIVSRTKTYAYYEKGKWKAKMGGIRIKPEDFKISMLIEGFKFENQLTNDRRFSIYFKGRLLTENTKVLPAIDEVKHKAINKSRKIRKQNKEEMINNMIQLNIYD